MIKLHLLGSPALIDGSGTALRSVLERPKQFALLAYLAAARSECRRDSLLALFWPELDAEHARKALRQSLYALRNSLGPNVITGKGEESVGIDPGQLWCDVPAFLSAVAEERHEDAVTHYRGVLLDGFHLSDAPEFEHWLETERQRLALRALESCWRLANAAADAGDPLASRRWGERALALAPVDEESLRRYLELMGRLRQPAAAVRAYDSFAERLAREFELQPDAETQALLARVRTAGAAPAAVQLPAVPARDAPPAANETSAAAVPVSSARRPPRVWIPRLATLALVLIVGYFGLAYRTGAAGAGEAIQSLAILPLQNHSGRPDHDHLANGLTEFLISELSRLQGVSVTSITSVRQYERGTRDLPSIARALGVRGLVEGSVTEQDGRLLVTLRLVDAARDVVVWSQSYDGSAGEIMELQARLARDFQAALNIRSTATSEAQPTASAEAYAYYLQGNHYLREQSARQRLLAEQMFEKAVALDPAFAKALERLVYVRSLMIGGGFDTLKLAGAAHALQRLEELGPDLEETHAARGWYALYAVPDAARAAREFEWLRRRRPGDAANLWALAQVEWVAARWHEAEATLKQVVRLDPGNAEVAAALGQVHTALRRYDEAEQYLDRAISLAPDNRFYYNAKWRLLSLGVGDTTRAWRVVEQAGPHIRPDDHLWQKSQIAEIRRDYPGAIAGIRDYGPTAARVKYLNIILYASEGGNTALARVYADSLEALARQRLDNAVRRGNAIQVAVARYDLGYLESARGRHDEAVRHGEEALRLAPLGSHRAAPEWARTLVWIYKRAGRLDDACALLEQLVRVPGGESAAALRLNPLYDGLRDHARFPELLRLAHTVDARQFK